jgi:hypothetical protein
MMDISDEWKRLKKEMPAIEAGATPVDELKTQVGGNHYKSMNIQPIEFIYQNSIPYHEANVIKYVCRHRNKNGKQDLLKAQHYIKLLIAAAYP